MEYEKKYNEAQKWIESIYPELSHEQQMEAEAFFPELAESEDERVRKGLLKAVSCTFKGNTLYGTDVTREQAIAWLEKQGEQKSIDKEYTFKSIPRLLDMIEPTDRAKSYCKKLIDSLQTEGYSIDAKIVGECLRQMNGENVPMAVMDIEKQSEQKPADKVEPKFHKSDWITNGDYTWKIVEVKPLDYILQSQDGNIVDDTISHVDEQFHSFTIEDAKDGDVLVVPPVKGSKHSEQIFIFKEIKDREYVKNAVEYYCRCMDNEFAANECGFMGQSDDYFEPATKTQRDTLIKAMTDAGWEFDFEKKELKKISQRMVSAETKEALYDKPAWSEEDEKTLNEIFSVAARASLRKSTLFGKSYDYIKWQKFLKSLRPQNKWKPSEEQMEALESATENCAYSEYQDCLRELIEQLKKLK